MKSIKRLLNALLMVFGLCFVGMVVPFGQYIVGIWLAVTFVKFIERNFVKWIFKYKKVMET